MGAVTITPDMLDAFNDSIRTSGHPNMELYALSAALTAVLDLPATRQAVLDQLDAEHAAIMAALPDWDDMSDADKGATLLHIHKRDNEGESYAVENYPARYFDDPRLTALDAEDACDHAAQFEEPAEDLDGDEYERLYNLALDRERSTR